MSKSLALQPLQTARHLSMCSFSKQHTTVSLATRAASTSVLGKEQRAGKGVTGKGITGKDVTGTGISGKGVTGKGVTGKDVTGKGIAGKDIAGKGSSASAALAHELPFQLHKLFISCKSFSKENVTKRGIRNCVTSKPSSSVTWEKVFKGIQVPKYAGGGLSLPWHLKLLLIS